MDSEYYMTRMAEFDPDGMYGDIASFPDHLEEGMRIASQASLPEIPVNSIDHIIVCGMGGSAIGADLVRSYLADRLGIPMSICRHYRLPGYAGKSTLVIGSSYSGNTEETLSSIADAERVGAQTICITTGGKLEKMAAKNDWACVKIPPGMMPRAALAYSFVPLLVLMSRLGFAPGCDNDLQEATGTARSRVKELSIDNDKNEAMKLAEMIRGRIPIIYAGQDHIDAVAVRFKGQICENSKQLAFTNVYPEFNHNELVGWSIFEPFVDKLIVITLRDIDDHKRVSARMKIVGEIFSSNDIPAVEIASDGDSLLSRMMSLIQFGDFTSFFLAMLNRTDPSPVHVIDHLKSELDKI
ncbi:MAG: bifunctional phosphoglucose/phosphomannose isomerase [candidate division Zixibacteria bacterium]|nr:bifunctional phosphoglucose/phosphomannose isomerase [candidate division Zixibacteria bacterium]MBU1470501.1 bifunctional phosphoglucose/phosphomannose isomerase [candidate division Zixibacteria bacterium]MBU2626594.1 bifunctional phosphoglucose/phosphomannose isomerase [candidate division Zixibacteria bacterium]